MTSHVFFGPLAAGIAILGWMIPGYSHTRQTVGEIREVGILLANQEIVR